MSVDVEKLKASVDIVSVIGAYTPLKKLGVEYVAPCPIHGGDGDNFFVNPRKGIWSCFSRGCHECDEGNDVIGFIRRIEGLSFQDACERLGGKNEWKPAAPVKQRAEPAARVTSKPPSGGDVPSMTIAKLGEPSATWQYKDADGSTLGYVARYETPEGKQIRCWTWGARGNAEPSWGCGHWTKPRPLYGLDRLAKNAAAPVLIVEGEKTADAGQGMLPAYAVICWPGGANAWKHADLEPLRDRSVLLWPDNDQAGSDAMRGVAAILVDPRGLACQVSIIDPAGQPDGWDIADWTGTADELITWAKPRKKPYVSNTEKPAPQVNPLPPPLQADVSDSPSEPAAAGPSDMPPAEFPPEATLNEKPKRPKRQKPHLTAVDGNTALALEADDAPFAMSEDALADHFGDTYGDKWRFVKAWNTWFEWRTDGWYRDDTALVDRLAVQVTRQAVHWREAEKMSDDGKRRLNSKRTAGNLRDIAMNDRRIAATVDQWDIDPWLLGVPGGVVDLRCAKLMDADPENYITKRTSVAPQAGECPHWRALLVHVTSNDDSMISYLQRLCGYILTGETREEMFAFIYGPAQTGKSTFSRVLQEILGDYHKKASMETFTESRHERHAEELAVLVGARLVTAVETEEGKRWNESRIKALTGRDRIRARFMRENSFEFDPQFKLVIAGNHAPHLRNVDDAMRRRLHIIPFTRAISMEDRDDTLAEKLRSEYPQILYWMVQGALAWQDYKLGRPDQISAAVNTYLESEDTIGEWLTECATRDPEARCLSGNAYRAYKSWAESAGEYTMSQKRFVQALLERGFNSKRTGGKRYISGFSLLDQSPNSNSPYND